MSTEIVPFKKKMDTFRGAMVRLAPQMRMAAPKHVTAERLARIAMSEVQRVPKLLDCTPESLFGGIMTAAQLGFEIGGPLGHCYLIPFDDRKKGITVAQFIMGYKGMVELGHRSSRIGKVYARVVYEQDKFEYQLGTSESITHVRGDVPEEDLHRWDKIVAAYAVCWLKGADQPMFEVMTRAELSAIRARSRAASSGPWVSDTAEMCKKTVIRRLYKLLPLSPDVARAAALDEMVDANLDQAFDAIDVSVIEEAIAPANDVTPPKSLDELREAVNSKSTKARNPGEEG